jgi:hypothetical protein
MLKVESFHPRVIIVDHFNDITNQIDIKTELLLCDQNLTENDREILNKLRQTQLKKIGEIQKKNLEILKYDDVNYKTKWHDLIINESLTYQEKLDIIKRELIFYDCIFIEENDIRLGCLWVTRWFYNRKDLEFLRYKENFY